MAREAVGLTVDQLAPRARISADMLRRYEREGVKVYVVAERLMRAINHEAERKGLAAKAHIEIYLPPSGKRPVRTKSKSEGKSESNPLSI